MVGDVASAETLEVVVTHGGKSVEILAKSIFKSLTEQGYDSREIVSLATELLGEVTANLSGNAERVNDSR